MVPTLQDFSKETGPTVIGSLGKLSGDIFLKIAMTVGTVLQDCTTFINQHRNVNEVRLAQDLANGVQLLSDRLEYFTMTFRQMLVTCTLLQRLTLELLGLVEYCQIYKPIMQGVARNRGCAEHLTELLYQVGIPFWLVHPVRNLPRICIDKLADVVPPPLELYESCMSGLSVIYEGPVDIVAQHNAVMQHANTGPGLSFKESAIPRPLPVAASNTSGPVCSQKKKRVALCKLFSTTIVFLTNLTTRQIT